MFFECNYFTYFQLLINIIEKYLHFYFAFICKSSTFAERKSRSGAVVAHQAHNLGVVRSSRASATKDKTKKGES